MTPTTPAKFRVAIVGAGLGGLLFALLLQKHTEDVEVDIYESACQLSEVGAGVAIWPRNWEILRYLDLEDELLEISGAGRAGALPTIFRKADEPHPIDFARIPPALYSFYRAHLQQLLAMRLRAYDKIQYAKRLASYAEPTLDVDPVVLRFQDGTEATCDLLVGCDGIKSAVRGTMYTKLAEEAENRGEREVAARLCAMIDPVWSGRLAYRGLIPAARLEESVLKDSRVLQFALGKNKHVVSYPISGGNVINIVAYVENPGARGSPYGGPWVSTATTEEVVQQYAGWNAITQSLVKALVNPTIWAIHSVDDLPTYIKGRVVLLGDAAHAMTPHLGAGVGQAIEDGLVLSTILAHPSVTLKTLPGALKIYDGVRRPFAQGMQRCSHEAGSIYHLNELGWDKVSAEESAAGQYPPDLLTKLGKVATANLDWNFAGNFMEGRDEVIRILESVSL